MVETTANEINRKTTKSDSVKLTTTTTTTTTSTTKTATETTGSEHQPYLVCVIVQTKRIRGLFVYDKVFVLLVLLLFFLSLTGLTQSVDGCLKSSIYYRTKVRTRSHVFAPGEYQPRQWEHTAEASGPLDVRDFQHTVPTKRLVRVTSPHILFDSEEARWMTKVSVCPTLFPWFSSHEVRICVLIRIGRVV
ncbi:Hedgehog protein [Fasciola gigantica]|uniref:Hedgehog protein n=1 Tax=Fasciola gigantica TaxID=46835 RepID=A0A504YRB9_FASGI|nr:Hedgehog protein [Fasciola gigantica]